MNWTLTLGLYPGILLGFRSYNTETEESHLSNHVFYLPFVDFCLTIEQFYDEEE